MKITGQFLLEKFPGKGGWTFAKIHFDSKQSNLPFGMIRVRGSVDQIPFEGKHLMPLGDGNLFLPISKPLRKKINKEAGDFVSIEIIEDTIPTEIPSELVDCLEDFPGKLNLFKSLSDAEQKRWVQHIFNSTTEETKANRIIQLLNSLI